MKTKKRKLDIELLSDDGLERSRGRSQTQITSTIEKAPAPLISLPYYVPQSDLPAKLPSTSEIEGSGTILCERTAAKVVSVGPHFVVKYGKHVDLEEGRTMKFVEDRAGIPVPRIYALFTKHGKNYIIMERIYGKTLEDTWHTLQNSEKISVTTQIKMHLQNLRAIPSSDGYCSVDNKPLRDSLFRTGRGDESMHCDGPFKSVSGLTDAIIKKYRASALKNKANFYEENLPKIFRNHPPTFTHGDLQRKNIMIRATSEFPNSLVFLDWESAGWYPTFWEYAQTACGCGLFEDDWNGWITKFLEPFPCGYAWLYMMQNEIDY